MINPTAPSLSSAISVPASRFKRSREEDETTDQPSKRAKTGDDDNMAAFGNNSPSFSATHFVGVNKPREKYHSSNLQQQASYQHKNPTSLMDDTFYIPSSVSLKRIRKTEDISASLSNSTKRIKTSNNDVFEDEVTDAPTAPCPLSTQSESLATISKDASADSASTVNPIPTETCVEDSMKTTEKAPKCSITIDDGDKNKTAVAPGESGTAKGTATATSFPSEPFVPAATKKRTRDDREITDEEQPAKRVNMDKVETVKFTKDDHASSSTESSKTAPFSPISRHKHLTTGEIGVENVQKKNKSKKKKKGAISNTERAKSKYSYVNLPTELHELIFQNLHPITSVCLGVTCRFLYMLHRKYKPYKVHLLLRPKKGDSKTGYLPFLLREWMAPKYLFREGKFYSDEAFRQHMAEKDAYLLKKRDHRDAKRIEKREAKRQERADRKQALKKMGLGHVSRLMRGL